MTTSRGITHTGRMGKHLTIVQTIGALVLLAFATLIAVDLWNAAQAQPCPNGPNCYPWGGEGPVAGTWSYASKTHYLVRGSIQLVLFLPAALLYAMKVSGREPTKAFVQMAFVGLVAAGLLLLV